MNNVTNESPPVTLPLTLLVPIALIVAVALATWLGVYVDRAAVSEKLQQQTINNVTLTASRLGPVFELALRSNESKLPQEEIGSLAANREYTFAALIDESGKVMHSMRLADIGKPIKQVIPDAYRASPFLQSSFLNERRQSLGGKVNVADDQTLIATFPLTLGMTEGELRPSRIGNLILIYDYSATKAEELANVTSNAFNRLLVISLVALGLGLFFHFAIARRLNRLALTAANFGLGNNQDVHSGVGGNDEVGKLAWSLDRMMADKVKADRGIVESEQRLNAIMEAALDAIITIDSTGTIRSANRATEGIFGYAIDELVGNNVSMLMPSPQSEAHDGHIADYMRTGVKKIIGVGREDEALSKSGRRFPVDLSISEVVVGDQTFFLGVVRDITKRKEAEEREIGLGRILDESLNEVFIFDAATMRFLQVNRGARNNIGYSMDELESMTPVDVQPEHTQASFDALVLPLQSGEKQSLVFKTLHQRKDESCYDVEVHLQPTSFQGKAAYAAIILDITESNRQRNELLTLATRLELAVQSAQIGLWDWTFEDNAVYFSREWKAQLGYDPDELANDLDTWKSNVHPNDLDSAMAAVTATISNAEPSYENEFRMRHKDGSYRHIVANGVLLKDDVDGAPYRMLGTHLDVSDSIEAAQSLENANEQLEQRVRDRTAELVETQKQLVQKEKLATLGQVSGGIAHEIRNPLNAITTSTYYLLNKKDIDPLKHKEHLDRIERQVTLINNVVTALSDVAKMPAAKLKPFPVVESIKRIVKDTSMPGNIDVVLEFPDDLPSVMADEFQLPIVFRNLVRNARDAMPDGGTLTISATASLQHVKVSVKDTGIGIAPDDLVRIMEPLFSTKARGMGLGLAISKSVLEKNQGRMDVTSELGVGTEFTVELGAAT